VAGFAAVAAEIIVIGGHADADRQQGVADG